MADQIGTPGSNADNSINGGAKAGIAPKDKSCPFCKQQFTSSSLGRHLDLYIKEKNPKPPDGLHDVDEIHKMRGGITRRQPRNSVRKREDSASAGTPGAQEKRSPHEESAGDMSPSFRRDEMGTSNLLHNGKPRLMMLVPGWEATGVMNNIPAPATSESKSADGGEERELRRSERGRSVSKQVMAKSTFEQKQKLTEALDNAKAAELALRELLSSIRAANRKTLSVSEVFDYDPLALNFPALCLQCLPAPPTILSTTPVPNPDCWSISPPGDAQYEAVRAHFATVFRNYRNTIAISSTEVCDDLSYPPPSNFLSPDEDRATKTIRAEVEANELEMKINSHIHDVFAAWNGLSSAKRTEIWTLELARDVSRKAAEIQKLKKEKDYEQQVNAHLQIQNYDLSRLQQPREFRLVPPKTLPIGQDIVNKIGDMAADSGMRNDMFVGFTLSDRNERLEVVVDRAVERWKGVIKEARGAGAAAQRSLSDGSTMMLSPSAAGQENLSSGKPPSSSAAQSRNSLPNQNSSSSTNPNHSASMPVSNGLESIGSDADADADADMEEDDSYADLNGLNNIPHQGYRMMNGAGKGRGMEGIVGTANNFGRVGI